MSDPVYCGTGTIRDGKYGPFLSLAFTTENVQTMLNNINQKGWLNVNVSKRKNQISGKPTHSLVINFGPEDQGGGNNQNQGGNYGGQNQGNQGNQGGNYGGQGNQGGGNNQNNQGNPGGQGYQSDDPLGY